MTNVSRGALLSLTKRRLKFVGLPGNENGDGFLLSNLTAAEMRNFRSSLTDSAGELRADRADHDDPANGNADP